MKIGTDVSLDVCRKEGYMMAEYNTRKLYTKGELNGDVEVHFFSHFPDYVLEDVYGTARPVGQKTLNYDFWMTAEELWGTYLERKIDIDEFIGEEHKFPVTAYDCLRLASDLASYGLIDPTNNLTWL